MPEKESNIVQIVTWQTVAYYHFIWVLVGIIIVHKAISQSNTDRYLNMTIVYLDFSTILL